MIKYLPRTYDQDTFLFAIQDKNLFWLIVEGTEDCMIYTRWVNLSIVRFFFPQCNIFNNNKLAVIDLIKKANAQNARNVAGIVDADFDRLTNSLESIENLFYSECHDIEIDLFLTNTLKDFVLQNNFLRTSKNIGFDLTNLNIQNLEEILSSFINTLRIKVFMLAKVLGVFRYIASIEKYTYDINLVRIRVSKDIKSKIRKIKGKNKQASIILEKLYINPKRVIEILRTKYRSLDWEAISEKVVSNMKSITHISQLYQLCNGHDVLTILGAIMGFPFKDIDDKRKVIPPLEDNFRSISQFIHLINNGIVQGLHLWSKRNNYQVFKPEYAYLMEI